MGIIIPMVFMLKQGPGLFDKLVQDCSISIANVLEVLQSCTKPSIWFEFDIQRRLSFIIARFVTNDKRPEMVLAG